MRLATSGQTLKMIRLLTILLVIALGYCVAKQSRNIKPESSHLEPFKIIVTNYDYSMAYGLEYLLTEKNFKITLKGELEGETDSLIYSIKLRSNEALKTETLKTLSGINLNTLEDYYTNPCISDGSQISVELKKENTEKIVHLSNYYYKEVGLVIELINDLPPKKYKIWYNKDRLVEDQNKCK